VVSTNGLSVHYSVSFPNGAERHRLLRQLAISLTSLRVNNSSTRVVVFCHGDVPPELLVVARQHEAVVVERPPLPETLGTLVGALGPLLAQCPTMHKFVNFGSLASLEIGPTVFLDCDTVIFGSLAELHGRVCSVDVAAREELGSAVCRHADRRYLDESLLADAMSPQPVLPAFNTGVVFFNRLRLERAEELDRSFAMAAVRFLLWMAKNPPVSSDATQADVVPLAPLRALLTGPDSERLGGLALPYPSVNRWLLDEAALWVALGEAGLTFQHLEAGWSAQGAEPNRGALPRTIWHYFSSNQHGMEARLGLSPTVPHAAVA